MESGNNLKESSYCIQKDEIAFDMNGKDKFEFELELILSEVKRLRGLADFIEYMVEELIEYQKKESIVDI